ncbi:MAG: ATP-binding cassette domain-containing protein [Lachnospiraceae bacterium]|nr:ATP-binding cassette domain-containing protein [Lachnospiraceae bacterium]
MEFVFKSENLCKKYGGFTALKDLNMEIPKGAIYGFVGKNGAGKTTLIRCLCGLQKPTTGSYELMGISWEDKNIIKSRQKMGAVVEAPAIYKDMTARDNLIQQCLLLGLPDFKCVDELLKLVGLSDTGKKKAGKFSLGMRQRLGIAIALCGDPDFIILDEPTNGLDPQGIIEIRELILKLNHERGITFLISSHILDELARMATHYGFIDKGHLVRQMSSEELQKECRKSVRMKVDDTVILAKVLEEKGIEYKILDSNTADVYAELVFSEIAKECDKAGCTIINMEEHDESLEAFYLSLLGGNENV